MLSNFCNSSMWIVYMCGLSRNFCWLAFVWITYLEVLFGGGRGEKNFVLPLRSWQVRKDAGDWCGYYRGRKIMTQSYLNTLSGMARGPPHMVLVYIKAGNVLVGLSFGWLRMARARFSSGLEGLKCCFSSSKCSCFSLDTYQQHNWHRS